MKTSQFIIQAAEWYEGKTEKPNNSGFTDPAFQQELASVGWLKGYAWCAYFTKLIYTKAYKNSPAQAEFIRLKFNGGALSTFNNVKDGNTFKTSDKPTIGAIAVWQHGNSSSGHVGIVMSFDLKSNTMVCIEGNTNANGSREGDRVAVKLRTIVRERSLNGLNLKGFILPVEL
ncbi:CHAP domain-containing protein [Sphingobacterium siyangense]|uniref:CHAP domain-containing protein n=1 Tax=Sphingobacterium siyangense TaxID=459529 RepID=UPI003017C468